MAIVGNGQITLVKVVELGFGIKSVSFAIAKELMFKAAPHKSSHGGVRHDRLQQVGGDRAVQLEEDDAIPAHPVRAIRPIDVGEDVVSEGVPVEGDEEKPTPPSVVPEMMSRVMGTTALLFRTATAYAWRLVGVSLSRSTW